MRYVLVFSLLSSILVWFLNSLAVHYSLYWTTWWYDIPMHLLGGFAVGMLGAGLAECVWVRGKTLSFETATVIVLLTTFVIGVGWELFEYVFDLYESPLWSYAFDTVKDIVMDLGGAAAALWWVRTRRDALVQRFP